MKQNNSICALPWMHIATNSSGNLRLCCNSTPSKNLVLKKNGNPYKINKDSLTEAWNSDFYKNIRKQMLNNERPDICHRCYDQEDNKLKSARNSWNQKWLDKVSTLTEEAQFDIKYIDIRLGNLCNLKCRMCNPYASNKWLKDWLQIGNKLSTDEYNRLDKMTWPKEDITWENLLKLSDDVEEIYLTGGEPTIIKEQYRLLDYLIEDKKSNKIKIKYNTNLVKIPDALIERWKYFKTIKLNCSIDAYGKLNNYIRHPSKWETIESNFIKLFKMSNVKTEIHCTVQLYNIFHIDELINWATNLNCSIYFNVLNHPNFLNIRALPSNLKEQVKVKLDKYKNYDRVNGIITYLESEDWSHLLPDFYTYTNKLDFSRDEKYHQYSTFIKIPPHK